MSDRDDYTANLWRRKIASLPKEEQEILVDYMLEVSERQSSEELRNLEIEKLAVGHRYQLRTNSARPGLPASRLLEVLTLVVPRRLAEEEIGDALERIHRLVSIGSPRWQIWLKVASTVFWICLNSLHEITSAVRGRASAKP